MLAHTEPEQAPAALWLVPPVIAKAAPLVKVEDTSAFQSYGVGSSKRRHIGGGSFW
jgi:hypothetical protein